MAGRVGNRGYNYFSEESYRNLQKAVDIMTKLEQVTKGAVENQTEQVELVTRYKAQLAELGVKKGETLKSLERELEIENEIMKARAKEANIEKDNIKNQKTRERVAKFERDYQREISDRKREEIEQQRELDKLYDEAKKKVAERTLSEKEYNEELNKVAQKYKEINEANRIKNARASTKQEIKEGAVNTLFGTSKQDVQDIKDGVYWWKFGLKVFNKAVEVFSDSVKRGIDANYNSTENTLNRIITNNSGGGRFGWSRGGFSSSNIQGFDDGKSYTGFKQINDAITDQLSVDGLYDNVSNTDVMEAIANVTNQSGFGLEDAIAKGYQDTVIKYIVPYLDTTTEAFDDLEMIMPRYFKKCSSNEYNS